MYREAAQRTLVLQEGQMIASEAPKSAWLDRLPILLAIAGFLAGIPLTRWVGDPSPVMWITIVAGIVGGAISDPIHAWLHPPRIGAPTVLTRTGHRLVITTDDQTYEIDVSEVRRSIWAGKGFLGRALVLGRFGVVACAKELDLGWSIQDFVTDARVAVDEDVFRALLDIVEGDDAGGPRIRIGDEPAAAEEAEAISDDDASARRA